MSAPVSPRPVTSTVLVDVAEPLVDKINADGVTVRDKSGEERTTRVEATTDPAQVGPVDVVVVFVKCYQTEAAARAGAPLVGDGTVVASLQNGWGNEEVLAQHFGAQRVVAGVTYNSGSVLELGKVAHTSDGPTLVGPFEGTSLDGAQPARGGALLRGLRGRRHRGDPDRDLEEADPQRRPRCRPRRSAASAPARSASRARCST